MPILRGSAGIGRLRAVANRPSACSLLLQLFERELQRAAALRLEMLADDLIFAFRFIDRQPAARDDVDAVLDLEFQVAVGRTEHDRLDLRGLILEREVDVAGVPHPAVRDFALDPELPEAGLEGRADAGGQLRDGDDAGGEAAACRSPSRAGGSSSKGWSNRPDMSAARRRQRVGIGSGRWPAPRPPGATGSAVRSPSPCRSPGRR